MSTLQPDSKISRRKPKTTSILSIPKLLTWIATSSVLVLVIAQQAAQRLLTCLNNIPLNAFVGLFVIWDSAHTLDQEGGTSSCAHIRARGYQILLWQELLEIQLILELLFAAISISFLIRCGPCSWIPLLNLEMLHIGFFHERVQMLVVKELLIVRVWFIWLLLPARDGLVVKVHVYCRIIIVDYAYICRWTLRLQRHWIHLSWSDRFLLNPIWNLNWRWPALLFSCLLIYFLCCFVVRPPRHRIFGFGFTICHWNSNLKLKFSVEIKI